MSAKAKTRREVIHEQLAANKEAMQKLHTEIVELKKEALLLCDDVQWFVEKKEVIGRGKSKREVLVGRIHWNEDFKDEDTGETITIERTEIVRVDGEWR